MPITRRALVGIFATLLATTAPAGAAQALHILPTDRHPALARPGAERLLAAEVPGMAPWHQAWHTSAWGLPQSPPPPAVLPVGLIRYVQPPGENGVPVPPPAAAASVAQPPPADLATLGEQPPQEPLLFLRAQAPLLAPGQWQLDVGLTYSLWETEFPVDVGGEIVKGRFRARHLTVPLEVRYGWRPRVQLFSHLPVGWANTEFSLPGFDDFDNDGGIGDLRSGATMHLYHGCGWCPDVFSTISFTAPTSGRPVLATSFQPFPAQFGDGYWALSSSVLLVNTFDPVVVFYGAGLQHRFEREVDGVRLDPGLEAFYQLGVGFAINQNVTLSGTFLGSYIDELRVDGQRIEGTILEPMRMRLAATIARGYRLVEPFAEIPMTDDAPAQIGVVWTF